MSGQWRVDPAGVRGVLGQVESAEQGIIGGVKPLGDAVRGAAGAAESAWIGEALEAFFGVVQPWLDQIEQRIPAAVGGAVGATLAVIDGDGTMAEQIEANAASAFTSTGHGRAVPQ